MASQNTFQVGDLVQLKSGGPVMTVQAVPDVSFGSDHYYCQWFAGKKLENGNFPGQSLQVPPKE